MGDQQPAYKIGVTGVMEYLKSPMHCRAYLDRKKEQTAAMREGVALHMAVFEPEKFCQEVYTDSTLHVDEGVIILKTIAELTTYLKTQGVKPAKTKPDMIEQAIRARIADPNGQNIIFFEEMIKMHESKIKLTDDTYQKILNIRDNVFANKFFSHYRGKGEAEKFLDGEIEGVLVRGRVDWMMYNEQLDNYICIDLKKVRSAEFRDFQRDIAYMKYHVQAWLYCQLIEQNYGKEVLYAWMCSESAVPHVCEMYACDTGTLEAGEALARYALRKYKHSVDNNYWPGYSDGNLQNINLPSWAFDQVEAITGGDYEQDETANEDVPGLD